MIDRLGFFSQVFGVFAKFVEGFLMAGRTYDKLCLPITLRMRVAQA